MKRFNIIPEFFCPKCGQSLPTANQEEQGRQCPNCGAKAVRSGFFWLGLAAFDLTIGLLFVAPIYSMSPTHFDEYREVRSVLAQSIVLLLAAALVGVGLLRLVWQLRLLKHHAP